MFRERKHIRLRNFDYSSEGAYFITICTKNREYYFGNIEGAGSRHVVTQPNSEPPPEMILSEIGKITFEYLNKITEHFPQACIDEFIIMPNHIHCILILDKPPIEQTTMAGETSAGTRHVVSLQRPTSPKRFNQFSNPISGSVSVIIQQFKSSVKRWCNKNGRQDFQWQPRFHEHIIRDDKSYENIKSYIINNPVRWKEDTLNQQNK